MIRPETLLSYSSLSRSARKHPREEVAAGVGLERWFSVPLASPAAGETGRPSSELKPARDLDPPLWNAANAKCTRAVTGSPLTVADLPAPDTDRWVIRRKAEVVA